jgi:UDP-glucose:(heptosyl)LPS alpha-1,3-glucosyltransferase
MKLAVCLYKYFPFGGLARDFMRIMEATLKDSDELDVFAIEWQGPVPSNVRLHLIPVSGWSNHARLRSYLWQVLPQIRSTEYDLVIGFNKMPGLDLYYAADPCYIDRAKSQFFYPLLRFTGRVAFYAAAERAVFGPESHTVSLMISDVQQALFKRHYATPDSRLIALPPGIDPSRRRPPDADEIRARKRAQWSVGKDEWLLLMVGTGFKTKGVDRSIEALAQLPETLRAKARLMIIGDGDGVALEQLAEKLGIGEQVEFMGGRADVGEFLLAADVLMHPARKENTGTVILEAIVAGLPVLVSDVCGYAKHVTASGAGEILNAPDDAAVTAGQLASMLNQDKLAHWKQNELHYAEHEDLYSMPDKVAAIIRDMAAEKQERS